jgi:hypothetical protein
MKALKIILIILVILIGIPLVIALFVDKDFSHEESLVINAPVTQVWNETNTLKKMDAWSPWTKKDPELEQTFEGAPGTVGAKNCWDSQHPEVGAGCQTITKVGAPYLLETRLDFSRPQESTGMAIIKLEESGSGTKVTWRMESEFDYPMNLINLFMTAEEAMGPSFQEGLGMLKDIVEK